MISRQSSIFLFFNFLLWSCSLAEDNILPKSATDAPALGCKFEVRRDGPDGEPVASSVVLDMKLYYSIGCEPSEGKCLWISNCTVSSDSLINSTPYMIIDSNGCSLESSLYENVEYLDDFTAGIVNPYPIRFRGSSSAVLLFCITSYRIKNSEDGLCPRPTCA